MAERSEALASAISQDDSMAKEENQKDKKENADRCSDTSEESSPSGSEEEWQRPKTSVPMEQQKMNQPVSLPWEDFFMYLAFAVSLRSKDEKSRVGCVIVSPDTLQILSTGYNGYTRGIYKEEIKKGEKSKLIVHAEANAISLKGHMSLKGAYAFVTLFPCLNCAIKLIQARIKRVYFLSLRRNDSTKKSWQLLTRAGVELIPYPRDSKNGTPEKFGEVFIEKLTKVYNCILQDLEKKSCDSGYQHLKSKSQTKEWQKEVIKSQWATKDEKKDLEMLAKNPFDLWEDWFMFIALTAAMKSTKPEKPEGCILIDSQELKICGMSYRGFPRGIESTDPELKDFIDEIEVSAITNALSLKFKEGKDYYCFATHFPNNDEAKYIAQGSVKKLFFICPTYTKNDKEPFIDPAALRILEKAEIKVISMTVFEGKWKKSVIDKITKTLKWHKDREGELEEKAKTKFSWPTPEIFRGLNEAADEALTLVNPLIFGGKGGIKPSRD